MLTFDTDKKIEVEAITTYASTSDKTTNEKIPNTAFDSEYMTEWGKEVKYLASKGIMYTFVKRTKDYNIKQYKYKKTPDLFMALAEFYYQVNNEKTYNRLNEMIAQKTPLNAGESNG